MWKRMALAAAALTLVLGGCGIAARNGASPPPRQDNNGTQVRQQAAGDASRLASPSTATRLEQLASRVPGVRGANCVMLGNTAIVGLDVDGRLNRTRVGSLKYTVAQALRKDPSGTNAIVTADIDLASRIRGIRSAIAAGKPVAGFAGELGEIAGRIAPQLPGRRHSANAPQRAATP